MLFDKTNLILIKNVAGTPGTCAENAIYGLNYFDGKGKVFYSQTTRDFRDANIEVQQVDYEMEMVIQFIKEGKWELLGTQKELKNA